MGTQTVHYEVAIEELPEPLATAPTYEDIAALAHALWQERGCPEGSPDEDWFRAVHQLKNQ